MLMQYILLKVRQSAFFSTTQVAHSSSQHLVTEPILHTLKRVDNYAYARIPPVLPGQPMGLVTWNTLHMSDSIGDSENSHNVQSEYVLVLARTSQQLFICINICRISNRFDSKRVIFHLILGTYISCLSCTLTSLAMARHKCRISKRNLQLRVQSRL